MSITYKLHWQDFGYEIIMDDYISDYETKLVFGFSEIDELNKLYHDVEKDVKPKYITIQKNKIITQHKLIIKGMQSSDVDRFNIRFKSFLEEVDKRIEKNINYIANNKAKFLADLNKIIQHEANAMKASRSEANRKYYLKRKEQLTSVPKPKPTSEELKERRVQYNKKYYETHKPITEAKEPNKKADYNKKYYASKKELLERIKLLESCQKSSTTL